MPVLADFPQAPTMQEWLVLIRHDASQAQQLFDHLLHDIQAAGGGANVAPHIILSFRGYHQAHVLILAATTDLTASTQLEREIRIGTLMLAPYPSTADWQHLLQDDPDTTRAIVAALQLKRMFYGSAVATDLVDSLDCYAKLSATDETSALASG